MRQWIAAAAAAVLAAFPAPSFAGFSRNSLRLDYFFPDLASSISGIALLMPINTSHVCCVSTGSAGRLPNIHFDRRRHDRPRRRAVAGLRQRHVQRAVVFRRLRHDRSDRRGFADSIDAARRRRVRRFVRQRPRADRSRCERIQPGVLAGAGPGDVPAGPRAGHARAAGLRTRRFGGGAWPQQALIPAVAGPTASPVEAVGASAWRKRGTSTSGSSSDQPG